MTPMMLQYMEIKEQNKDCIIFYRLGDFYEMFFSDAKIAERLFAKIVPKKVLEFVLIVTQIWNFWGKK